MKPFPIKMEVFTFGALVINHLRFCWLLHEKLNSLEGCPRTIIYSFRELSTKRIREQFVLDGMAVCSDRLGPPQQTIHAAFVRVQRHLKLGYVEASAEDIDLLLIFHLTLKTIKLIPPQKYTTLVEFNDILTVTRKDIKRY